MTSSKKKATEAKSSDLLKSNSKPITKKATKEDVVDPEELAKLEKMENEIREGIIKYYETGMLLQRISGEGLFKLRGYKSFSEYCKKTFNFSRSYGYRLIAYCRVWNILKDDEKEKIPERVIRALAQLHTPEEIQLAWEEAKSRTSTDDLPLFSEIEESVKKIKFKELSSSAEADSSAQRIIIRSLRKKFPKDDQLADNIIAEAKGKLRQLLLAVKEVKAQGEWDDTTKSKLKNEITKLQQEQLKELFAD